MKNISFDNPLWLLILIPLALGVIIPFAIAIRRDNKSKSVIASLIIHMTIVLLVGLGVAGTVITTVMTQTHVYVVADVSYSAEKNMDKVDEYLKSIKDSLPKNSKMGVVCFGKDYVLHTDLGAELTSVKDAKVDNSATDIASALDYVGTLFGEDVIKKVVLLTDGKETVSEDTSGMISAVEKLVAANVSIDAIYLDSNIKEDVNEVQLTRVEFTQSTYLNHETTADILVQSNLPSRAVVSVYKDGAKLTDRAVSLERGYNVLNFSLPTDIAGKFDYEVRVSSEGDTSAHNNSYSFTQSVASNVSVLFVTSEPSDIEAAERLFGKDARIEVHYICEFSSELKKITDKYKDSTTVSINQDPRNVPCSVEALCKYDEIVLSSIDIRELNNVPAFVDGIEVVVSQYGKSLVTMGDTKIQNKEDATLESLENMLPVKFGNSAQDSKLYAIVIDTSRSMFQASRFAVAKQAAIHLLSLLSDDDEVIVVTFAGDIEIIQPITKASNRQDIAMKINQMQPQQGTSIGGGLAAAVQMMVGHEHDIKQVMLISDGMNYSAEIVKLEGEEKTPIEVAQYMLAHDVKLSTMNPYNSLELGVNMLENLAREGGGQYYYIESEKALKELVFSDIADDITDAIGKESPVFIELPKDDVMNGVSFLPSIKGYVQSKAKHSANTVLTVEYEKASGAKIKVPLYSYWKYGNGKVTSFTGTMSGEWMESWQEGAGQKFLQNVTSVNVPEEKIDRPFSVEVNYDGINSYIEILPAILDPYAKLELKITCPDGKIIEESVGFDASRYFYSFESSALGAYEIHATYTTDVGVFGSDYYFNISYSPEYDSFANFDASTLHAAIRHRGTVSEEKLPDLSSDGERVATYRLTFTIPFMIAAVALYVIDIIIRKIKWSDIRNLFKRSAVN